VRRVVVVGDGGWGTAIAIHLSRNGLEVAVWSHDAEYARHLREKRTNPRFLPGHEIPASVEVGTDIAALLPRADLLVSAVPTEFLRPVWTRHAPHLPPGLPVLSLTKGVEQGTQLRPSEILAALAPGRPVAVMSGPNIAWEVAKGLPAATVAAGADAALVRTVREAFSGSTFRVYGNKDAVGVELGGALKNVIAIAAGMCDGLGLGHNAKAALVTRGIVEMARLGVALGAERSTFFGLAGLGDLLTTCYSPSSRNRTFGERLGRGERPADVIASMAQIAEGAKSAAPIRDLAHAHGVSMPITDEVCHVLHEGRLPKETVESLMLRGRRDESEDLP
jgi:glycerol-3-phosphate dehydrogenase (NAD(P)+)